MQGYVLASIGRRLNQGYTFTKTSEQLKIVVGTNHRNRADIRYCTCRLQKKIHPLCADLTIAEKDNKMKI